MPFQSPYNYQQIEQHVADLAKQHGRDPNDITVISVSKGVAIDEILNVHQAGCLDFGESRVPDALEKIMQSPSNIRWHMIGSLQSKKIPKIIGPFNLIHSVDTPHLAEKISECTIANGIDKPTSVLLQVNTSGEKTKHGLDPDNWKSVFESLLDLPGIKIEGLMTMAPNVEDQHVIRTCFARLRELRTVLTQLAGDRACLHHLSMGMSNDYPLAIAEGATLLRIGTAIFKNSDTLFI